MGVKFALLRHDTAEAEVVVDMVAQDNDVPGRVDPRPEDAWLAPRRKMACPSDAQGERTKCESLEALSDIG
jgi:hypothetical protein